MQWDTAQREPKPIEGIRPICVVAICCLNAINLQYWWLWVLAARLVPFCIKDQAKYYRERRTYRAWVAWDEAGGPDA